MRPGQVERIKAELSEGPVTPVYDPNTDPSEHLLPFNSSSSCPKPVTSSRLIRCAWEWTVPAND